MKYFTYLLLTVSVFVISCEEDGIDTGELQFNIDLFEQNIIDKLTGQVPGYAYAINRDQILYAKGADGFADVSSSQSFTPELRMHVASVSKTITATAVMKILMNKPGVDIDSPVLPYLPDHWTPGPNVENLTFKNLLTHKSGFPDAGGKGWYDDLQDLIEGGLNESDRDNTFEYYNDNYSLFRIILPILTGKLGTNVTDLDDQALAWSYMEIIREELFDKMNIDNAFCKHLSNQPIIYYNCGNNNTARGGDHTLRCGAYGWNLSAFDLAAFMAFLRYENSILDVTTRQTMDDEIIGWENEKSSNNGEHGTYLYHQGQWHYGDSTAAGLETCIMKFPENKVEVSLLINCVDHPDSDIANPRRLLRKAYDNAWE